MNPLAAGLMLAVAIATAVYGRHLETEITKIQDAKTELRDAQAELGAKTELETLKKWNQDRMESLHRQILDLRANAG
jgi:predicted  nucleic acid-binding Zn-ribbon protein